MSYFKGQSAPWVFDFKSLLKDLSCKEAEAHSDVDAFMEHCAKRWQTREGTYHLKRRRLKPDVRDPPEDGSADVDMADIWTMDGLEDYYMVEENLWGAERGAFCFTLFHLVLRTSLVVCCCFCVCLCVCLVLFLLLFFSSSRWTSAFN